MKIEPHETKLIGDFVVTREGVRADATCKRVDYLVENVLRRLGSESSGWETLYIDPADGRYWELTFPQSQMHGGGPRALVLISRDDAERKYGSAIVNAGSIP